MGTLLPGPLIGKRLETQIKAACDAGHEIGLHAWDHHKIQSKIDTLSENELLKLLEKGCRELERITGRFPVSSAAPGWRCSGNMLKAKARLPFKFNSDCRGSTLFRPDIPGAQVQIPVTLPTYDELIGNNGVTDKNYNSVLIKKLNPARLNILTIHAEAEGGKCAGMFDDILKETSENGWKYNTLGSLLPEKLNNIPQCSIEQKNIEGREGWLAVQKESKSN
jgi:undecaprenyl phosphate-alpha-L-ara4FN deformylase